MAIDSEKKRKSIAAIGHLPIGAVLIPDGSIDAGDRAAAGGTYAGISLAAPATVYYVDSNAIDDTGDGSIGDPWKYVNTHMGDVSAGDTIYLRGGATPAARQVHTQTAAINPTVSGSAGNPITIINYPGEYVTIRGASTTAQIFRFTATRSYWTISGTDSNQYIFIDRNGGTIEALHIFGDNFILEYCEVADSAHGQIINLEGAQNTTIRYCEIHDGFESNSTDSNGIRLEENTDNTVIEYNTMYDFAGDCIAASGTTASASETNIKIRYNTLYTTLAECSENAVDLKTAGSGTEVHNNTMYGFRYCPGTCGGSGADGYAVVVHQNSDGVDIYDNIIYDCAAGFNLARPNVRAWGNLFHSMVQDASAAQRMIQCTGGANTFEIYNNTFNGIFGATEGFLFSYGSNPTVNIYNNLFNDTSDAVNDAGGSAVINYGYNGWFGTATRHYSGTFDVVHLDPGGDPKFWDEAGDDYRLKASSKAVNAGTIQDPFTNDRVGTPDIGYYEVLPVQPLIGEIGIEHVIFGKRVIK